jgi:hypothetical protein
MLPDTMGLLVSPLVRAKVDFEEFLIIVSTASPKVTEVALEKPGPVSNKAELVSVGGMMLSTPVEFAVKEKLEAVSRTEPAIPVIWEEGEVSSEPIVADAGMIDGVIVPSPRVLMRVATAPLVIKLSLPLVIKADIMLGKAAPFPAVHVIVDDPYITVRTAPLTIVVASLYIDVALPLFTTV